MRYFFRPWVAYSWVDISQQIGPSLTVEELQKIAQLFNMTTDKVINYDGNTPKEVVLEDKNIVEQMRLIQQLDEVDRQIIFTLIGKMPTNEKFKDFFQKNVATL